MGTKVKLPVFEVVSESFKFAWKKLPAFIVLNLVTTILVLAPIGVLAYFAYGDLFGDLMALGEGASDEDEIVAAVIRLLPLLGLIIIAAIVAAIVTNTAVITGVARNKGPWLPHFNKNALRYLGSLIVVFLLVMLVGGILTTVVLIAIATLEEAGDGSALIIAPLVILAILAFYYVAIRLSLVPVDAITNSKLSVKRGWAVSKGNVLRILGAGLATIIFIVVIAIGASIVLIPLQLYLFADIVSIDPNLIEEDPAALLKQVIEMVKSPAGAAYYGLSTLLDIYLSSALAVMPAIAYGYLTGKRTAAIDAADRD